MKFKMPTASKTSLDKLLEYLGDTKNYSEYYSGNRAEDFKKCCDVESEWCWKYADLLLRGLNKRKLGYKEGHHGVPRAFYGVKRNSLKIDSGNWFVLSYGEHLWAHYCMIQCATSKMQGKMARAFITMYKIGICKKRPLIPSESEVLNAIPDMELRRIQAMEPQWAKVEAEGRTHVSEDPKQYKKDYQEANHEKIIKRKKARYEANKEVILKRKKASYEVNKEKILERDKVRYEVNKEVILKRKKASYEVNKEEILKRNKARYDANKEEILKRNKTYREAKKAAGYRQRKDPATGKRGWVFVGLPETKITEVA